MKRRPLKGVSLDPCPLKPHWSLAGSREVVREVLGVGSPELVLCVS